MKFAWVYVSRPGSANEHACFIPTFGHSSAFRISLFLQFNYSIAVSQIMRAWRTKLTLQQKKVQPVREYDTHTAVLNKEAVLITNN